MQDLKVAFRQLLKNPGFTAVAVLTLALGIGANTAMFSTVNALWLRALPFPGSDDLVLLWGNKPQQGRDKIPFSWPNFADLRTQARSFESLGVWALGRANLTGTGRPEQLQQAIVDSGFFTTMGTSPVMGRTFLPSEDERGSEKVVILSHGLWARQFGADANILGRSITLDGQGYEVVGVMPATFKFLSFPKETEIWLPFGVDPFTDRRFARAVNSMGVIGRLKNGITLGQAEAEASIIARSLAEQHPENKGWEISVLALRDQVVSKYRLALMILLVAVGFVLVIGCANIANLLLARAASRQREFAVRAALGASRVRLVRQLLCESLLLAGLGGILGLLIAWWSAQFLSTFPIGAADYATPYSVPRDQIRLDGHVLWFTAGLTCLTALLFGLVPAVRASRTDLNDSLKNTRMEMPGARLPALRSLLVTGEVAVSLVLLIGAGLLIRSLIRLQEASPGFQTENLLTANISLPRTRQGDQVISFYNQLLQGVGGLPGVKAAGLVEYLPMSGIDSSAVILVEGAPEPGAGDERRAHNRDVSPDYFKTMGIALIQGRDFEARDAKDSLKVAIVNETMARRYWPNQSALGKRVALVFESLRFRRDGPPDLDIKLGLRKIVGIVADVKHSRLDGLPVPEMYVPLAQRPVNDMTLVVRTAAEPAGLVQAIQGEVAALDKDQPISGIATMSQLIAGSIAQPRFQSGLLSAFAAIGMILAAVGLYGLIAFSVSGRTREIGIRMAVGAQRREVLALVLRQAMKMVGAGILIGVAAAFAMTRAMTGLLYEIGPADPLTFTAVPALLVGVALLACWLPARRAAHIDPMEALRCE
jgi:putative ABC transport system permease protein